MRVLSCAPWLALFLSRRGATTGRRLAASRGLLGGRLLGGRLLRGWLLGSRLLRRRLGLGGRLGLRGGLRLSLRLGRRLLLLLGGLLRRPRRGLAGEHADVGHLEACEPLAVTAAATIA